MPYTARDDGVACETSSACTAGDKRIYKCIALPLHPQQAPPSNSLSILSLFSFAMFSNSPVVVALCFLVVFAISASAATVVQRNFIDDFTSAVGSVASDALSGIEHVGTIVTSAAGHEFTLLTADGGHVLTLAASGEGVATSIAGTLYTVATGNAGKALNGALSLPGPLLGGFVAAFVGMTLGAFMIF